MFDANGALVATANNTAVMVEPSQRQRLRREPKRILATLVFTDIVGSTQLAEQLGDARWRNLLEEHRAVVRGALAQTEGVEVQTVGDGFLIRFDSPARALACARAIREGVCRLGIEIRAGVHTGECELQGAELAGIAVHIAARIGALAAPSEVLVSRTVRDLVTGSGLSLVDRGVHTLKGVPEEWHLFGLA
jgi:class 3 adenylate cyclase